jgi:hypothetical protein
MQESKRHRIPDPEHWKQTYLRVLGAGLWNNRLVRMLLLKVDGVGEVVGLGAGLAIKNPPKTHPKKPT